MNEMIFELMQRIILNIRAASRICAHYNWHVIRRVKNGYIICLDDLGRVAFTACADQLIKWHNGTMALCITVSRSISIFQHILFGRTSGGLRVFVRFSHM